ncbi:4993_t:CDS:2, partial [Acaulospora morrowiae]
MFIKALIVLFTFTAFICVDHRAFSNPISTLSYSPSKKIFDLHIKKEIFAPDGYTRNIWTINGTLPGPTIRVTKGDSVKLRVYNELDEGTAIHGHGFFQRGTNWYDGVPGQTQCPIPAHSYFEYDFSIPDQSGTYWYHSHFQTQYVDGMIGAFIVDDPDDPYLNKYDEEYVVILQDFYHTEASELLASYLKSKDGNEPVPDCGLINGLGRYNCSRATDGKCKDNSPLAKFKFESGKVYRLRIINAGVFAGFFFSIDQHELELIEVDGTYVKPQKIHRLPINVAQRYSVLVRADKPPSSYWMRSEFMEDCLPDSAKKTLDDTVKAIVKYDSYPDTPEPDTIGWKDNLIECIDLDPSLMKPLIPEKIPDSDKTFKFIIEFKNNPDGYNRAFVNDSSYAITPYDPTLLEVFNGKKEFPVDENVYYIEKKQYLIDTDVGEHPFHLHGHKFWILTTGNGTEVDKSEFNTVDPISRDTTTVPALGFLAIRFIADNPGVWAFHCHIEWHLQVGLVVQFIELPDEIKKLSPPSDWRSLLLAI